ncbi:MAG TPA: TIM-barrel domain-containing protein, partial [Bacteroidales bacterium]|nr:TIM-barrel domain-containing protein [Bacteroidales bacterium]
MYKLVPVLLLALLYSCQSPTFTDEKYSFQVSGGLVTVSNDTAEIDLEAFADDMMKVSYYPGRDSTPETESFAVILDPDKSTGLKVKEKTDRLLVSTAEITAEITKAPFAVSFYDNEGNPLLESAGAYSHKGDSTTAWFKVKDNDHFYGMGQKSIPVDRKGYAFRSYNQHIGGYTKPYATMQINIPYIYSPDQWGVFFDNTYPGYYDLAKTDPSKWSYRTDNGTYTYYFVHRKTLQPLLNAYYDLTGYFPMFPKWTLGLLQSKCAYEQDTQVYRIVNEFRKDRLPLDAIILDANWFGGYKPDSPHYMGNFTWYQENFPHPQHYLNTLKSKGIKTILINEPYINL